MENQFLTLTSRYLFPEIELNASTVRPVLGDISAFFSLLLLVHSGIFIFQRLRAPAHNSPALQPLTTEEPPPALPPLPVVSQPDTLIPVASDEGEDEDHAWDAAFYRAHIGDPGNYFLDYSLEAAAPPRHDCASSDSASLPPPERSAFTRLVQAGGVFRALRGNSTRASVSSHTTGSTRSVTTWPDLGLAQEDFEDAEMDRIAAALVNLRLTPGDVLAALQLTYPDLRIAPALLEESDRSEDGVENLDMVDVDAANVDVRITGLDLSGVEEKDQAELVDILRTLYRLKLFVDGKREDEKGRSVPGGEWKSCESAFHLEARRRSRSNSSDNEGDRQPDSGEEGSRGSGSRGDEMPPLSEWSTNINELLMLAYNE
ncbi:hypothetical protein DFP73DRAFT_620988 [Morchella snyderi]|nr:hypothetical protein DFP73DRAFT_620988 [Morchella snyderi]